MNADGSDQKRVTNNPVADFEPAWSPNRTRIAFTSDRDGNPEIYVMNSNGSGQTLLTNHPAEDYLPNWGAPGPIVPPPPVAYRALVPVALAQ